MHARRFAWDRGEPGPLGIPSQWSDCSALTPLITIHGMTKLPMKRPVVLVSATLLFAVGTALGDEHEGTLVLKVDGKDVTLKLTGGQFGIGEAGEADYFGIGGERAVLEGQFDLNGDGKATGTDKLVVDEHENVKTRSMLNKPSPILPTAKKAENFVDLPDLGRLEVMPGSTLTVTSYKGTGDDGRWAGTVKLVLKGEKGTKTVTGKFDCGTGME